MWPWRKPNDRNENVLPSYDFSEALSLPLMERFEQSAAILRGYAQMEASAWGDTLAPLSPGFSDNEIAELERVQGAPFAPEVREFLRRWQRIEGSGGLGFYGSDSWMTNKSMQGFEDRLYLVIGDYWRYADGDLLIMPTSGEIDKVFLYLHEDGPKIEELAPSFSLALWRMAHEDFQE